ncbi:MAG: cob(I)yrinic acid a,c-diamide adenosyltransferase [Bacteroidales bacterium]|nr:cob(I)yrinic acid a,c-diamide adenosyltransferase [Bacteroidales bacterium]
MKIYTKAGDSGKTSLIGGIRIEKFSEQIESYGTIDELNSATGVAIELLKQITPEEGQAAARDAMVDVLDDIQCRLFTVGSILATDKGQWEKYWATTDLAAWTAETEGLIDQYTAELPELKGFILPSGSLLSAQLHVCRTICRRAERRICHFVAQNNMEGAVCEQVMKYANRLSDFYFISARKALQLENKSETIWKSKK